MSVRCRQRNTTIESNWKKEKNETFRKYYRNLCVLFIKLFIAYKWNFSEWKIQWAKICNTQTNSNYRVVEQTFFFKQLITYSCAPVNTIMQTIRIRTLFKTGEYRFLGAIAFSLSATILNAYQLVFPGADFGGEVVCLYKCISICMRLL